MEGKRPLIGTGGGDDGLLDVHRNPLLGRCLRAEATWTGRWGQRVRTRLVAELEGRVIGHIAFSPVTLSDGTPDWCGLGPVSVQPEHQRQGVGSALIREGLGRLKAMDARGCCLVGHPEYYRRFGFENAPGLVLDGVPPEVSFVLSFGGPVPAGRVFFHEAFRADGPSRSAPE
ncbi:MAG: N-acetyltransferase [Verrucomicrobiales bacterium]|nr:N-acetyltransferase [Verrucomicrobiales bacterium]